jgi:hypothetical protein
MGSADRAKLAAQQAQLVQALAGKSEPPQGFDAERLQTTATALAQKRQRAVARAWPALTGALGEGFAEQFAEFAARTPLPRQGGPLADGRAFARFLAQRGDLPEAGRLEALAVDVHYVQRPFGLVPRRGPTVRLTMLKQPRRLVMALRLPWLGEHWFTLRLGWRRAEA